MLGLRNGVDGSKTMRVSSSSKWLSQSKITKDWKDSVNINKLFIKFKDQQKQKPQAVAEKSLVFNFQNID